MTTNLPAIPAWNEGRIIGPKRSLEPTKIWAIRGRLEIAQRLRELALFNPAINSKLRRCDLVKMTVAHTYAAGQVKHHASSAQGRTQKPVRFEINEGTREAIAEAVVRKSAMGAAG